MISLDVTPRGLPKRSVSLGEMSAVHHSEGDAHGAILYLGNGKVHAFFNGSPVADPLPVWPLDEIIILDRDDKVFLTALVVTCSFDAPAR